MRLCTLYSFLLLCRSSRDREEFNKMPDAAPYHWSDNRRDRGSGSEDRCEANLYYIDFFSQSKQNKNFAFKKTKGCSKRRAIAVSNIISSTPFETIKLGTAELSSTGLLSTAGLALPHDSSATWFQTACCRFLRSTLVGL